MQCEITLDPLHLPSSFPFLFASAHPKLKQASMSEKTAGKMDGKARKKAVVVGCGVGGAATAARLACAGFDVEVYEKVRSPLSLLLSEWSG